MIRGILSSTRKKQVFLVYYFLCFLLFLAAEMRIYAQDPEEEIFISHTPSSFTHGEIIQLAAEVSADVEWVRIFYRYGEMKDFQVRSLSQEENRVYSCDFDTSVLPALWFEYYFEARKKDQIFRAPANAPDELFSAAGESDEPLPEVQEEFPSPEEEAKKFKLKFPFKMNATFQTKIHESGDSSENKKPTAGNIQIYTSASRGSFGMNFDSNLNYAAPPLEGDKNVDLSNMMLSLTRGSHALNAGDITVNETEFTVFGLGRRGMEYLFNTQKIYFHLFDINTQQPKGFDGFGIPKSGTNLLGGAFGYRFLKDSVFLKAIYLTGNDDPSQGVNVGYSSFVKSRKGQVAALFEETHLFQDRLILQAEFARCQIDEDTSDTEGSVYDNAWKVGGVFSSGIFNFAAKYQYIGDDFNPIGYQYFTSGIKGYETAFGINWKSISLNGTYKGMRDNVDDDPEEYTTENREGALNLNLNLFNRIAVNLGMARGKQDTSKEDGETLFLQDCLTEQITGMVMVNLGAAVCLSLMAVSTDLSSENNPQYDNSNLTFNLGGNIRPSHIFTIMPNFSYSIVQNKFTKEEIFMFSSFTTAEVVIIPQLFSTSLTGTYTRTVGGMNTVATSLNVLGGLNVHLKRWIKFAEILLSLKGNYVATEMTGYSDSSFSILLQTDISF